MSEEDKENLDKYEADLKRFLIPVLRRASYRWISRSEALKISRVDRGLYECAECKGHFRRCDINIDHIEPVVSLEEGFENWDKYIRRMFPVVQGFQVLCSSCHEVKTDLEKEMRKHYRRIKKERNICKTSKTSSKKSELSSEASSESSSSSES